MSSPFLSGRSLAQSLADEFHARAVKALADARHRVVEAAKLDRVEEAEQALIDQRELLALVEALSHLLVQGNEPAGSVLEPIEATVPEPLPKTTENRVKPKGEKGATPVVVVPPPAEPVPAAPQQEPEPKPTILEPEPLPEPVEPKIELTGEEIGKLRAEFFDLVRAVKPDGWDDEIEARCKAAVCQGRALTELLPEDPATPEIDRQIELLERDWNQATGAKEFFGFNRGRHHRSNIWNDLSLAYALLGNAFSQVKHFESENLSEVAKKDFFMLACASASVLPRMLDRYGIGAWDRQQQDLYERLKRVAQETNTEVPYFRPSTSEDRILADVQIYMNRITDRLHTATSALNKEQQFDKLRQVIEEVGDDFPERLNEAVDSCLEAQIPATHKTLVQLVQAYESELTELKHPQGPRLLKALEKERAKHLARNETPEDVLIPEDEEHKQRLNELRDLLKGKVLLLVGGNKGQQVRRRELKNKLNLKDLIWPDMEENSRLELASSEIPKADVVAQIIRFSRHSYSRVLNEAKAEGKMVARITHGLGLTAITYNLHQQLIAQRGGTPK